MVNLIILYLFVVYRNLDKDNIIFDRLLTNLTTKEENDIEAAFLFIRNFNAHYKKWLSSFSLGDCHG